MLPSITTPVISVHIRKLGGTKLRNKYGYCLTLDLAETKLQQILFIALVEYLVCLKIDLLSNVYLSGINKRYLAKEKVP